jgi:O-antigen/teichoic acid export membrane protein
MLAQLGLRDLYTTERDAGSLPTYLALRLLALAGALAVAGAVAVSARYSAAVAAVIVGVAGCKAVEGVSDLLYAPMQRGERMEFMGRSFVYRGVLSVAAVAAAMYLTGSLVAAVAALLAAWALVLAAYDLPSARRVVAAPGLLRPAWNAGAIRAIAWMSLPLGGVALLGSLQSNTGRYLLELFSDRASLGYFTAVAATVASLDIIIVAMTRTALSRLGAVYHADVRAFRRELWRLAAIGALVGVAALAGGALLGRTLLTLAYGAEYGAAAGVLLWLLAGRIAVFVYTYVKAAQVVMRQLNAQLVVSLASSVLGFAAGVLIVPRYGLAGAAATVALTQWLALLLGSAGLALSFSRVAATGPGLGAGGPRAPEARSPATPERRS